jgi:hypothetical protein
MGMVEHVTAKCPTPNCKGELYDQIKGGSSSSYDVPHDGLMDANEARDVDGCTMSCHACGATARVAVEPIPQVRVYLTDVKIGDVNKTTPVMRFMVESMDEEELNTHPSYLSWRISKTGKVEFPKSLEEYMALQRQYFPNEGEPIPFKVKDNGRVINTRLWYEFKENKGELGGK